MIHRTLFVLALTWMAAFAVASCDRVSEACILARAPHPTAEEARESFSTTMEDMGVACYPPLNADPGSREPGSAENLLFCEAPPGIAIELGRSGEIVFVTLHLLSDGMSAEPEEFSRLRDAVTASLATVVGPEGVDVFEEIDRCPHVP